MFETFGLQIVSNIIGEACQTNFYRMTLSLSPASPPASCNGGVERGVVKPEHQGHRRLYSMQNLTEIAVICEFRRKGFSLQGVRKVMRFLEREIGKGLADIVDRDSTFTCSPMANISISNLRKANRGHSQEFESADSWDLPQRRCPTGAFGGRSQKNEYFGNFAGRASAC